MTHPLHDIELAAAARPDFWLSSGHALLDENDAGQLVLTPAFLKAYLARPELLPPEEACDAERSLHSALLADPAIAVSEAALARMADADARENWKVFLGFRDVLLNASSIEAAFIAIAEGRGPAVPPLFVNHLAHVIARQALRQNTEAEIARAGELFFRAQKLTVSNGVIMLADEEVIGIESQKAASSPLLAMFAGETAHMDIMTAANAADYWARSDRFDFILEFGTMEGGRKAFATALELWIDHLFGFRPSIAPLPKIEDANVRWIFGLDEQGSAIANALWNDGDVPPHLAQRAVAFFRIEPAASLPFLDRVSGRPIYMVIGMDEERIIRVKPQNLVTGLPLREKGSLQ